MLAFARAQARPIFNENCAACHGSGGAGAKGYPNLNDDEWLWGGKLDDIVTTIRHGVRSTDDKTRLGGMPAFGRDGMMKRADIETVADYVRSIAGLPVEPKADLAAGKKIFADNCASCHGATGKGNRELGAPDLTDAIWLYGSDKAVIVDGLWNGRAGVMPAWAGAARRQHDQGAGGLRPHARRRREMTATDAQPTVHDRTTPKGAGSEPALLDIVEDWPKQCRAALRDREGRGSSRRSMQARRKIYPQRVHGTFRRIKWIVLFVTLGIYYGLPFVRWDRGIYAPHQAVLVDLPNRRFYFFFIEIWPQEIYYLTGLLILAAMTLFLMNAVAGRVWCGYLCPQTVWTDLFQTIERWVEGDRREHLRRDAGPWTIDRMARLGVKHFLWLMVAWWTGGAWVLYFADAPTLVKDLATFQAPLIAYIWIGILT